MMTFTDDDLKRWKKQFEKHCDEQGLALIARLEAAEKWALLMWERRDRNDRPVSLAEIVWRKAAGK